MRGKRIGGLGNRKRHKAQGKRQNMIADCTFLSFVVGVLFIKPRRGVDSPLCGNDKNRPPVMVSHTPLVMDRNEVTRQSQPQMNTDR